MIQTILQIYTAFVLAFNVTSNHAGSMVSDLEHIVSSTTLDEQVIKPSSVFLGNLEREIKRAKHANFVKLYDKSWILPRKPQFSYGQEYLVQSLDKTAKFMFEHYNAPLVVHDISRAEGGCLQPHKSHRNGLDVDVGIYSYNPHSYEFQNKFEKPSNFKNHLSLSSNWNFIKMTQVYGNVSWIFLDQKYINLLRKEVISNYGVDEWNQYGRILRHEPGHKDHYHIRYNKLPFVKNGT
ncbi:penicillin-insensitive murein endopeptidase [Candidatus Woesearchaeota archaeon]|nr:penicillin-insensitive murein endopeptidase [Candidatus Woesearchaeota archaeon]